MHVIRHEDVRMDGAALPGSSFAQAFKVEKSVHVVKKAGGTIVTTLNDVQRDTG